MTRRLAQEEGLRGSCGPRLRALKWVRKNDRGMIVVVLLPDSGSRYPSKIYNEQWCEIKDSSSHRRTSGPCPTCAFARPARRHRRGHDRRQGFGRHVTRGLEVAVVTHGDDIVGLVDTAALSGAESGHAIGEIANNDYCVITDDTEILVLRAATAHAAPLF